METWSPLPWGKEAQPPSRPGSCRAPQRGPCGQPTWMLGAEAHRLAPHLPQEPKHLGLSPGFLASSFGVPQGLGPGPRLLLGPWTSPASAQSSVIPAAINPGSSGGLARRTVRLGSLLCPRGWRRTAPLTGCREWTPAPPRAPGGSRHMGRPGCRTEWLAGTPRSRPGECWLGPQIRPQGWGLTGNPSVNTPALQDICWLPALGTRAQRTSARGNLGCAFLHSTKRKTRVCLAHVCECVHVAAPS